MIPARLLAVVHVAMTTLLSPQLVGSAAAAGDDYPYRTATSSTADRWGFTKRQCVSFAAWRLAQAGRPVSNYTQRWGNAYNWNNKAAALGKPVTTRPRVGAIAQWNAYERSAWYANGSTTANGWVRAGGAGHVGVVKYVYADGSVRVEQYNMWGTRSYSTMRVRAPRYLYL